MFEKLMELLWCASREYSEFTNEMHESGLSVTESYEEYAARYLLAHGVVAPPCKLGDMVWYISTENPYVAFQKELKARKVKEPIEGILIAKDGIYINTYNFQEAKNYFDKVGEDYAYLTESDAKEEIKRREQK
ncbi:MAG: hypothetical protein IJD36_00420 [Clostridia bacterium]|nr:hypothetical protein [Clostridia bacterium]